MIKNDGMPVVLAIDGGIVNVGVALVDGEGVQLLSVDSIAPSQKLTTAQLAQATEAWVRSHADSWRLHEVDLVVVESVARSKVQAVGVAAIAAIAAHCGKPVPPVSVLKTGRTKFSVHPDLAAEYARSKGKAAYTRRKTMCLDFCRSRLPVSALPDATHHDWSDALLLALAGIKQKRWERRFPWAAPFVTNSAPVADLELDAESGDTSTDE